MEKGKIWKNIYAWIKENRLAVLYFVFAVCIEMIAVFTVEGNAFLSRPFIALGILLLFTALVLLIPSDKARFIVYAVLLAVQGILDLVFAVIYDMTGQYFDFAMLNLRNDAFAILENIPVNFITFYSALFFCLVFLVYGLRMTHEKTHVRVGKRSAAFYALAAAVGVATTGVALVSYYPRSNGVDKYEEMINGKAGSAYSAYGMMGNLFGELYGVAFKDTSKLSNDDIENFIYAKQSTPTEYFGLSKGKNVITILAESLEWYAFLSADEAFDDYPNALPLTSTQMEELYPNLRAFYRDGLVMSNFHSREKTDIAETISIMGSYPTEAYINYDYEENTLPHTVPNVMDALREESMSKKSFHNGFKTFYNRDKAHVAFGFEGMTDMYDMAEIADAWKKEGVEEEKVFHNSMYADSGAGGGLRNLDSEMVYTARNLIAPLDASKQATANTQTGVEYLDYNKGESFYSYITTITMHGVYYERDNLKEEQSRLAEMLSEIYQSGVYEKVAGKEDLPSPYCYMTDKQEILFQYMVTALDTDKAVGLLKADLEKKGLLDDTVIVLFGDHNAYYHGLSNYVKDIDNKDLDDYDADGKFTDLYNVPLMIYDQDLTQKLDETKNSHIVDKFTCTADIVPTVLDLLGLNYYSNLYYGNSVLSDKQSVLYSRAYDNFFSDGIVASSVNNVLYRHEAVTDEQLAAYKAEGAALVEKIRYCDYIFRQDYFAQEGKQAMFEEKIRAIN